MEFKNIKLESRDAGIKILRISRPAALNALNQETMKEMLLCLSLVDRDPATRCLVITGEGEKSFIAGADISEMLEMSVSHAIEFGRMGQEVARRIEKMQVPVIAAVNGYALGGGTEMAVACDFIYCSNDAVFGLPEVGLGVIPGFGGHARLPKFVGYPYAKEMIFSGRKIKAEEALRVGLVNAIHPKDQLLPEVLKTAESISRNSLLAVKHAKELLNEFSESTGLEMKMDTEAQTFGSLFTKEDQKEGMRAFTEKRKPKFA